MRLLHGKTPPNQHPARVRIIAIAGAMSLALAVGLPGATAASAVEAASSSCRAVQVPVNIPDVSAPGHITGDYCTPRFSNGDILLLVSGGSENAAYWDMPGLPSYSLVKAATSDGYAVFAALRA